MYVIMFFYLFIHLNLIYINIKTFFKEINRALKSNTY